MDNLVTPEEKVYVRNSLAKELVSRTTLSSLAFVAIVVILFFINPVPSSYIDDILLGVAMLINILRGIISYKVNKGEIIEDSPVFLSIKILSIVNAVIWTLFFICTARESFLNPQIFPLMFSINLFFTLGSIITLSTFKKIAYLLQTGVAFPYVIECFLRYSTHHFSLDLYVGMLVVICYFAGVVMTNKHYNLIFNLYTKEYRLKELVAKLSASQDLLLEQTQKLIHSSRLASLGEMSGGIAHEINNPLAVVSGHAERLLMLAERGSTVDSETLKTTLPKIMNASERIVRIVKGLKQFSREAEREPLSLISFDKVLQETMDLCSEKVTKRGLKIATTGNSDFIINCRSVQISQILINLINNAAYEIEKSKLSDTINIDFSQVNDQYLINVTNSTNPLSEEVKEKIFQPFFTTKEVGKGTGLGLSISLGLAQSHGGDLKFICNESSIVFVLSLPKPKVLQSVG